jgi:hypothetical protein
MLGGLRSAQARSTQGAADGEEENSVMDQDLTALSYWFPKLEAAGLPVPRTKILDMPEPAQAVIWAAFDGEPGDTSALSSFAHDLAEAAKDFGYPFFLRTDHTSGKHNWDDTCFVASPGRIEEHLFYIAEFSELCGFPGLPWTRWVVREFLPTIPLGVCAKYGNMQICREFRFFVDGGEVRCWHPYWPLQALQEGGAPADLDYADMCHVAEEKASHGASWRRARDLAKAAGNAAGGGSWSVDILETRRGWVITDMAPAVKSYHWPECPHQHRTGGTGL